MARTALTVQQISRAGLTPSYVTPDALGSSVPADNEAFIHVKTGGTGTTVTVQVPKTVDGQAISSKQYTIGTNAERFIGPFPNDPYAQASGEAYIDYSSITTVTVGAFRR